MNTATFEIETSTDAALALSRAVLIYAGPSGQAIATVHGIAQLDGAPTILAGRAMTAGAARRLARDLGGSLEPSGYLPAAVLCVDGDALVWWTPPAARRIWFRALELGAAERSAVVPHPGLVFRASRQSWRVWAIKGSQRPTPDTPLYQAPYFNVASGGAICQGNVRVPKGATITKIEAWNDAFFRSYFTHPNVSKGLIRYRGGAYAFWRDMLDGHFKRFPARALVATAQCLKDVLQKDEGHHA